MRGTNKYKSLPIALSTDEFYTFKDIIHFIKDHSIPIRKVSIDSGLSESLLSKFLSYTASPNKDQYQDLLTWYRSKIIH